ncbi:HEAT repeat domain-containing protein [Nostoc sp. UHCC 0251]|uniref:HEAT repeat domain-containing protein n=1 Tax=Nostoc sp. UHCC 0251 TaxID=3110240 RepID=UPI002B1FCA48|nr:HEAT repeat domain-containing protein [Nostoc sp. UHCC 0251]MEA5624964.1 HEAT repeat domain-containing protein [Nostoc sp. UHCC 0251]
MRNPLRLALLCSIWEASLKNEFIQKLINFKSGCGDFYWYRAYFLAAAGLGEFEKCNAAKQIVNKIVKWRFENINLKSEEIREEANTALLQTHRKNAIAALVELTRKAQDEFTRWKAAESLGKIDPGNSDAIAALVELTCNVLDGYMPKRAVSSLKEILTVDQMPFVVTKLKNDSKLYPSSYSVIWYCAQSLSYPEFYQAWHR